MSTGGEVQAMATGAAGRVHGYPPGQAVQDAAHDRALDVQELVARLVVPGRPGGVTLLGVDHRRGGTWSQLLSDGQQMSDLPEARAGGRGVVLTGEAAQQGHPFDADQVRERVLVHRAGLWNHPSSMSATDTCPHSNYRRATITMCASISFTRSWAACTHVVGVKRCPGTTHPRSEASRAGEGVTVQSVAGDETERIGDDVRGAAVGCRLIHVDDDVCESDDVGTVGQCHVAGVAAVKGAVAGPQRHGDSRDPA